MSPDPWRLVKGLWDRLQPIPDHAIPVSVYAAQDALHSEIDNVVEGEGLFARRKLNPDHRQDRQLNPASSNSKRDHVSKVAIENPTAEDPMFKGYEGTWGNMRSVKSSLKLTGSCGPEKYLHRLTCGHWIDTQDKTEPCGVNCDSPVYDNEAFRCQDCCGTIQSILASDLTAGEKEKLQHAKDGYHTFYIGLAVEYVAKHMGTKGDVTGAVINFLDDCGRPCVPSEGPRELKMPLDQTFRGMNQNGAREEREAKHLLVRHEKRARAEVDSPPSSEDDSLSVPVHGQRRHKAHARKETSRINKVAHGSKRKAMDTGDESSSASAKSPITPTKRTPTKRTPTKVLHNGATRSPYFSKATDVLVPKLRLKGNDEMVGEKVVKRRRVLKGPVWTVEEPTWP